MEDNPPPEKKRRTFQYESDSDDELQTASTDISAALDRYKAEPQVESDLCPLLWWKTHATAHPIVAAVAMKYFPSPATTVPCERLFSLSGHVVDKKRSSLSPNSVAKLVLLSNWLKQANF